MATLSRTELQSLYEQGRIAETALMVESIANQYIKPAAKKGLSTFTLTQGACNEVARVFQRPPIKLFKLEDLFEPLKQKFPGVDINHTEELVEESHPRGTYRKVQLITFDWS